MSMAANKEKALLMLQIYIKVLKGRSTHCHCKGMWIGSVRNHQAKPVGIKWPDEPIKAFGVYFTL